MELAASPIFASAIAVEQTPCLTHNIAIAYPAVNLPNNPNLLNLLHLYHQCWKIRQDWFW
jgi:hypothetical protein